MSWAAGLLAFCLGSFGQVVFAGGDGGNNSEKSKPKGVIEIGKDAPKAKNKVPNTRNLRATSGPAFRAHVQMEQLAQHDNLKSLAEDYRSLKGLAKNHKRINSAAKTQQAKTDAQNLRVQLQRYKSQKKNKTLKKNATIVLDALDTLPAEERLRQAEKKYAKAQRTKGNQADDLTAKDDYDTAYQDYTKRLGKLPKALRAQFPRYQANPNFK
ncbi:MAG: hypothetical protein AB8B82_17185 [Roseovarius sp.]